jgi:glycosyltransferase involved in cell wall biosynthesis
LRVLLINHRYFVASGAERYLFNVERELKAAGHEVAPFSIAYQRNEPSTWDSYFTSPIGSAGEPFHSEHSSRPRTWIKSAQRLFYSKEVEDDLLRQIDAFKPDVAYVLLFRRKLSVSILAALKKRNIPIICRVSDFNFLCEEHHFLRNGSTCTKCAGGKLWPSVVHRCVRGSLVVSAINAAATHYQRSRGFFDYIDRFVVTNPFLEERMVEGGFDPARLVCIPTFVDVKKFRPVPNPSRDYLLFAGRLDPSKGIETLLRAMSLLKEQGYTGLLPLRIVGASQSSAYETRLKNHARRLGLGSLVGFEGQIALEELTSITANAAATIIPSLWFENLPNSLLESLTSGVPVIASRLGSLERAIDPVTDGSLFEPGDAAALAQSIRSVLMNAKEFERLAITGPEKIRRHYSAAVHMERLMSVFSASVQAANSTAKGAPARKRRQPHSGKKQLAVQA